VGHLEEQQVGELLDVVAIREPVVAEDVAVVSELLNDLSSVPIRRHEVPSPPAPLSRARERGSPGVTCRIFLMMCWDFIATPAYPSTSSPAPPAPEHSVNSRSGSPSSRARERGAGGEGSPVRREPGGEGTHAASVSGRWN